AGDDGPRKRAGPVRRQHGSADPIAVQVGGACRPIERKQVLLPSAPALAIQPARRIEPALQARQCAVPRFLRPAAEAEGDEGPAIVGCEIDLAAERNVAVLGTPVALVELPVAGQQLPSVRGADIADRTRDPRRGGRERERDALLPAGEQHGDFLVVADPAGILGPCVQEMRCDQDIQAIIRDLAAQRFEADLLQQALPQRIRHDPLFDPITSVASRVDEAEGRDALLDHVDLRVGVALLLGEIPVAIGDEETEIARTGDVDARKIDFVEMRLLAASAVPTPVLALDVQRAGVPGTPGGSIAPLLAIPTRPPTQKPRHATHPQEYRIVSRHTTPIRCLNYMIACSIHSMTASARATSAAGSTNPNARA